jgi:hypothetical protein
MQIVSKSPLMHTKRDICPHLSICKFNIIFQNWLLIVKKVQAFSSFGLKSVTSTFILQKFHNVHHHYHGSDNLEESAKNKADK